MKRLELLIPPPVVTGIAAILMLAIDKGFPFLKLSFSFLRITGSVFILLSVLTGIMALSEFFKRATSISPAHPQKSSFLVTDGIYGISRNPMYLGLLLALAGWGFYLGNIFSFVVIPLFVWYMNRFQITPEEQILEEKFREVYRDYLQSVHRWLGRKEKYKAVENRFMSK